MNQAAAYLAARRGLPFILTHYGTEIWHYQKRALDPFLWMNQKASTVTYYSRLLLERSLELGVAPKRPVVVYPPVDERFRPPSPEEKKEARRAIGYRRHRRRPAAPEREAAPPARGPDVPRRGDARDPPAASEGQASHRGGRRRPTGARERIARLGLRGSVTLLGLVDNRELPRYYHAADLFVLPSRLEAFPTVAAEALAARTPRGLGRSSGRDRASGSLSRRRRSRCRGRNRHPLAEAVMKALSPGSSSSAKTPGADRARAPSEGGGRDLSRDLPQSDSGAPLRDIDEEAIKATRTSASAPSTTTRSSSTTGAPRS